MTKTNPLYHERLSEAITWLRFPLIFFIILLHCYSTVGLSGNHAIFFKAIYPFSLWLGETGVPGFFFISGLLFFYSKKSYHQKLSSRIHTLLIPYLLWNALLLFVYVLTLTLGHPQEINGKSIADYTWIDYLRAFWDRGTYDNGNFVPILCPFWYIRNLLIVSVLSPLFFYLIKYVREFFLIAVSIWWLFTPHNAFIPQTILFFSLGAYFSIHAINPLELFYNQKKWFLSLFFLFAVCDIVTHVSHSTPFNLQVHRLALIFNIPILFLVADYCCRFQFSSKLLPNAAFIVFCVHYPIVVIIRKICIMHFSNASDLIHILLYFLCMAIATILSILIYLILNKYIPKVKDILSGNR